MDKPLCIFHSGCFDGFTAAWVVREAFRHKVDFHPGVYGEPPPDVADRNVILVDFSYKRDVLDEMRKTAKTILILDHHKTAEADLAGFADDLYTFTEFDVERSGAGIAWDYFNPGNARPPLLNYVEDRDLWRFALPNSREVHAALSSYDYNFEKWTELMAMTRIEVENKFTLEGRALERKHHQDIRAILRITRREMVIGGIRVPVANVPITMTSDAGHVMAEDAAFAACYWDTPKGRVFSLRSVTGGMDVSNVASLYGGGGHAHAAGFEMPRGWEGDE